MPNLFDEIKSVYTKDSLELTNFFMINRFISFDHPCFLAIDYINNYGGKLPDWATKALLHTLIPKENNPPFLSYAKKKAIKNVKIVDKISEHFCCNHRHAVQILEVLRLCIDNPHLLFGLKEGE